MGTYIVPKVKFKRSCVKVEVVVQYMSLYIKYLPQSSIIGRCSGNETLLWDLERETEPLAVESSRGCLNFSLTKKLLKSMLLYSQRTQTYFLSSLLSTRKITSANPTRQTICDVNLLFWCRPIGIEDKRKARVSPPYLASGEKCHRSITAV